jgi:hypothetical protein
MWLAPLLPSRRRRQVGSTPQASGVSIPSPVTTTRLIFGSPRRHPIGIRHTILPAEPARGRTAPIRLVI